ncbi:universal stress protein [Paracoccus sp. R12_1]|jgi:nucleotide-binding universal stress UspA family protein|uniref:universal stress protein n=1 Tax=unclassified Paracoccus (in: a-proteobacteria) TaxID=2688777 RepID=UPI000C0954CD|nr:MULTISPECIES: universal stress protein [unclassified Paracoccus (in: a-proteobacteria)]MBO9453635.1 universal stress protein [Paracoccus sp. R12_2]MBO9486941.1 universal stress protein [Paracoccus sp. R12_1]PHQ68949.1 MAG: universal stress protein [Paracoccus sp. (in: a-proteobacteria)]
MSRKIVVGFDGSEASRRALDFAVSRAKVLGDAIVVAHVLEWSPYSFLTPNEIEERHRRRNEELQRAEQAIIAPVLKAVEDAGVPVTSVMKYGHIAETLCKIAEDEDAALIFIGRMGNSGLSSRIFGSVAGTLAQVAPVPVTIVP